MSFLKSLSTTALPMSAALKTASLQKRALATVATQAIPSFPTHVQAFLRDFKTNEPVSIINLNRQVFNAPLRRDILHRVVVWQRDAMRQGTHSTKGRADVTGTSKKAAPQKGRGKARVGNRKAPQFRGGGIAFGPKPRDHATDLPRKVQELGLRVALSAKYAQDQLIVVDSLQDYESFKTRELDGLLRQAYGEPTTLIVMNHCNSYLELAARNIPRCEVIHVEETNVLDLLTYDKVIIEKDAINTLEESLLEA
ncbi:ribosomal protein L4 domain-containing protein [Radiomyces spectabilis]|uniref:ribosomal protein L4 domain-containing protein n=1 Tax=Radiomyces spectabilis TaxID=64574 RepID=UPI00221F03DB|nr:ribosomal protein L4 domain-containing protein [Radiomyces spectabilis]KAI8376554.1 ribosomal protein L4 domain-containing protein [Radiomyces spectabilis]